MRAMRTPSARYSRPREGPSDHPVIVHVADNSQVAHWSREFPADAQRLAEAFWPGPLTLIVPRAAGVPDAVTGGQTASACACPRIRWRVRCSMHSPLAAEEAWQRRRPTASAEFRRLRTTCSRRPRRPRSVDPRRRRVRSRHREHDRRIRRRRADVAASRRHRGRGHRPRARPAAARTRCGCAARLGHARRALRATHAGPRRQRACTGQRRHRRVDRRIGADGRPPRAVRGPLDRCARRCATLRARPVRQPARARRCRRCVDSCRSGTPMPRTGKRCATAWRARLTSAPLTMTSTDR